MNKIAINITTILDQYKSRGIGVYTKNLVKNLIQNHDIEWHLIGYNDKITNFKQLGIYLKDFPNLYFHSLGSIRPSGIMNLFYDQAIKKILKQIKPNLYFNPNLEHTTFLGSWKNVVMIHDIIPLKTKKFSQRNIIFNYLKGLFYKIQLHKALKSDAIITNSIFSKTQIHDNLSYPPERIFPVYLGLENESKQFTQDDRKVKNILNSYGLKNDYILYYGGLEKNKNIQNLLEIFAEFLKENPDFHLAIASSELKRTFSKTIQPTTIQAKKIYTLANKLDILDKLIFTGHIDQKHLNLVLANCHAFVHLSKSEGFGLSVLEALRAGKPCLISNIGVYEELYKDFALLTNPNNIQESASKLKDICLDDKLRDELILKTTKISEYYNIQRSTNQTLEIFTKTIKERLVSKKDQKTQILFVAPYFFPYKGGAENYSINLAKALADNPSNEVLALSSTFENASSGLSEYRNIKIIRHKTWLNAYYARFYPGLIFDIFKYQPDVIHTQGFGFIWQDFCLILKRFFSKKRIKFLCTPHGPFMARRDYSKLEKVFKAIVDKLLGIYLPWLYDEILTVNPFQTKWISKNYNIPLSAIKSMPIGISEEHFESVETQDIKNELNIKPDEIVISYLGRFHKYKGIWDILKACINLKNKRYKFKMILMGADAGELNKMQRFIIQNSLEKKVSILHKPSDQRRNAVLEISEIFIFPSMWEAYGIAMVEAMAHKNAIISTKTEGGLFMIQNKENGILINYNQPDEIELAVIKLIEDEKLRNKMIKANYQKASTQVWDRLWHSYKDIYKKINH